ncbi:hypothetical protein FQZ97_835610 [compost metagenome]
MIIPACVECSDFLKGERASSLDERIKIVKNRISSKYKKPLRIYKSWDESELNSLSSAFKKSISAGISLGEEAYCRLRFDGYSYEYEGLRQYALAKDRVTYKILDEVFDNLRDALLFAARAYRINIHKLEEYFLESDGNIEKAVNKYIEDVKAALLDKKIKNLCRDFCQKHKQSEKFVEKTVRMYLNQFNDKTIEWCLEKIYEERVIKKGTNLT